jgi:hypothetical protein
MLGGSKLSKHFSFNRLFCAAAKIAQTAVFLWVKQNDTFNRYT